MSDTCDYAHEKNRAAFYEDGHILDTAIDRINKVRGEVIDELGFAPLFVIQQKTDRFMPRINLFETGESYRVEIELPGIAARQIELTVDRDALTLSGYRYRSELLGRILFLEQLEGDYSRSLRFETPVDGRHCKAVLCRGILRITLPKMGPETGNRGQVEVTISESSSP